jgi:hypothetical protein
MIGKSAVSKYPADPTKNCCELDAVSEEKIPYPPTKVPDKTERKPITKRIFGGCLRGAPLP